MGTLLSSMLLLVGGCVIVLDNSDPPDPPTPTQSQARQAFERNVYPILVKDCAGCHDASRPSSSGYGFLVAGDVDRSYELVMTVVLLSEPDASRLLTKGIHAGPTLTPDEAIAIRKWLDLEQAGL